MISVLLPTLCVEYKAVAVSKCSSKVLQPQNPIQHGVPTIPICWGMYSLVLLMLWSQSHHFHQNKNKNKKPNNFHVNTYVCFWRSQIIFLLNYLKFSVSFCMSLSPLPHPHINACFLLTAQTQIFVNFNVHCKIKALFCLRRCIPTFKIFPNRISQNKNWFFHRRGKCLFPSFSL